MKFYAQQESKDCGPSCLKMLLKHYEKEISLDIITELCDTNILGTNIKNLIAGGKKLKLDGDARKCTIEELKHIQDPVVIYINDNHYVVLEKFEKRKFQILDPAIGKYKLTESELKKKWFTTTNKGIAIFFKKVSGFDELEESTENHSEIFDVVKKNLGRFKFLNIQILLGILLISALQLIFPFLNQYMVDQGIQMKNGYIVGIILINQFVIFLGRSITELIQARIMLHVSSRLSIALVSNFFIQLMRLPISFFDTKSTGDIFQRISDHKRIETFLMTHVIDFFLSVLTFLVLGGVLIYYSPVIFGIFILGSALHFTWIISFMKKRKLIDYSRFELQSKENSLVHELVSGMQELKLYNAQWERKRKWEHTKIELYEIAEKNFSLTQTQMAGGKVINEVKNITINGVAAFSVLSGDISLGIMFSIVFMSGQLNLPIQSFVRFVLAYQDAKIGTQRISSIYNRKKDDITGLLDYKFIDKIELKNVSFSYSGESNPSLSNINLTINKGQKVAIVGKSGSGKTTLVKILLKFYKTDQGRILIDGVDLDEINDVSWRESCGSVMQEGYIFNDTILKNITLTDEHDGKRVVEASKVANIEEEINALPLRLNTIIGHEGRGLSKGQKQRLLIARAIYKEPSIFFFDEATSSLDTENEKTITKNLKSYLKNKTTIVVAHRLSTIIDADVIIVMDQGQIKETGTHNELLKKGGFYKDLVANQLDLNYI